MSLKVNIGLLALFALLDFIALLTLIQHVRCLACALHNLITGGTARQHRAPLDVVYVERV